MLDPKFNNDIVALFNQEMERMHKLLRQQMHHLGKSLDDQQAVQHHLGNANALNQRIVLVQDVILKMIEKAGPIEIQEQLKDLQNTLGDIMLTGSNNENKKISS